MQASTVAPPAAPAAFLPHDRLEEILAELRAELRHEELERQTIIGLPAKLAA